MNAARTDRARWAASLTLCLTLGLGCGDDRAGPSLAELDGSDGPAPDAGAGADAVLDSVAGPDTTEPGPGWVLPACDRACDRVTDCGVDACDGWSWVTAGELFARCWSSCDGVFEEDVLGASDCGAVAALASAHVPNYGADCDANPCQLGCERLGACVVSECPGFAPPSDEQIAIDCASACVPDDVAWVLSAPTCEALVDGIASSDAGFAQQCLATPNPGECPDAGSCAAYAAKVTGCMAVHCGDPIAPWLDGIAQAVTSYCAEAEDCPSQASVDYVLSAAVSCDSDVLAAAGPAPPFTTLCDGTVPVAQPDAAGACAALMACPGSGWLGSADLCAVYLAFRADAAAAIACLGAAGDCAERYACVAEE